VTKPLLPEFIRARMEQAANWKPPPGSMTLGDGKVRVLASDLSFMLKVIERLQEERAVDIDLWNAIATGPGDNLVANVRDARQTDDWKNEAAQVLAQFIHLSATPEQDAWAKTASRAIRLLNNHDDVKDVPRG
jgi:hypothetical protein